MFCAQCGDNRGDHHRDTRRGEQFVSFCDQSVVMQSDLDRALIAQSSPDYVNRFIDSCRP
jgi:hypothetical protein